jgi:hypothetical protein
MPQPRRELVPEARVDVPKVRPQGVMCMDGRQYWLFVVCTDNGGILLANPKVPKMVLPICRRCRPKSMENPAQ